MSAEASLVSHVVPNRRSFFPGEAFRGTWQVAYPALLAAQTAICLREVCVDVTGTEHVDPKWVSSSYHGNEPVVHTSARRVARHIFSSRGAPDLPQITLQPGDLRRVAIRCMLPRQLPPSFHGSAVRFSYTVMVTYRAEFVSLGTPADFAAAGSPQVALSSPPTVPAGLHSSCVAENGFPEQEHAPEMPSRDLGGQIVSDCSQAHVAAAAATPTGSALPAATEAQGATRSSELTGEVSPGALQHASPPAYQTVNVFSTPTSPTPGSLAKPVGKLELGSKAATQSVAKTTLRASFKVAIAPPDSLPTVPELEADGDYGTPRAGGSGGLVSVPSRNLNMLKLHSVPMGPVDPVQGPLIEFWMLAEQETAPVEVEVLPTLPIGAEQHLWASGPAASGRFFLWAPNEIEEVASGHASGLSARVRASYLAQSTTDVTNATSVDGDSTRDTRDFCGDSDSVHADSVHALGPSLQSQSSTQTSPRAGRLPAGLSEAGTPRVTSSRDRSLPPDLKAFSLSFQGCPLACIELHTPGDSPLQPGMTFSGTIDFRTPEMGAPKQAVCRQVVLLLETEEQVAKEWLRPGRFASAASSTSPLTRRLYHECQDVTCDALFTSFMFTVPPDVPPAFRTQLVSLRWFLRFEFSVVPPAASSRRNGGRPVAEQGGSCSSLRMWEKRSEQLVWRLPLPVVSAGDKARWNG